MKQNRTSANRNSSGNNRSTKPFSKSASSFKKDNTGSKPFSKFTKQTSFYKKKNEAIEADKDGIRLNKYIAHAGLASRREADEYIATGVVTVNGKVVSELGYKVQKGDEVRFDGKLLKAEKKVYVLLNKPKGFTTPIPNEKTTKSVMDLVANASPYKLDHVGNMERQATGVLLFTNDEEMAKKLMDPKLQTKKIYHVSLDRPLDLGDFHTIKNGIELDEGIAILDKISYIDGKKGTEIGIETSLNWNKLIKRIFEAVDYEVIKLDRVYFAGLTKKALSRGHWKILTTQEVNYLKML